MNKSSMQNGNGTAAAQPTKQDANKIVDQAKQAVTHVASDVADRAMSQVNTSLDGKRDKAVETMGSVASAIRETGEKLKGVGPLADVAGKAANSVEKVANFFDGKQIGDVVRDVERFARREPALFIGAAFAVGLIGGRFLKSSAHRGESDAGILADSPSSDRGYAPPSRSPRPAAPPFGSSRGFQASTPRPPPKRFSAESASTGATSPTSPTTSPTSPTSPTTSPTSPTSSTSSTSSTTSPTSSTSSTSSTGPTASTSPTTPSSAKPGSTGGTSGSV